MSTDAQETESDIGTNALFKLQAAVVRIHRKAREAQRMERMVDAAVILDDTLQVVSVDELTRECDCER